MEQNKTKYRTYNKIKSVFLCLSIASGILELVLVLRDLDDDPQEN